MDCLLSSASEMFAGASDVFSKVFAASKYAAMPDVSSHAAAGFAHFGAARFHLSAGCVAILLGNNAEWCKR